MRLGDTVQPASGFRDATDASDTAQAKLCDGLAQACDTSRYTLRRPVAVFHFCDPKYS